MYPDSLTTQPAVQAPGAPPVRRSRAQPVRRGRALAARAGSHLRRGRNRLGALAGEVGQGTVEYVGLLLLMATILAGVVAVSTELGGKEQIGKKVVTQIGASIDKTAEGSR